jgi:chemotaxis protein CheD
VKKTTIGIGEYASSNKAGEVIQTLGLGSCIAVVVLCPKTRTVGMVHVALPDSMINPKVSIDLPGYYANTGIPALLKEMARYGVDRRAGGCIIKLVGGASVMDANKTFAIGARNLKAILEVLDIYGARVAAKEVGGNTSRSVAVSVDTGKVSITSCGKKWDI